MCTSTRTPDRTRGFGLIELMVGVVVGMVTVLAIAQSFAAFEQQKRNTTGAADAQDSGLTALHFIETDARMAGYGFVSGAGLACTTINYYNSTMAPTTQLGVQFMPVQIIDGGAGPNSSDSIVINYSTSPAGAVPAGLLTSASNSSQVLTVQGPAVNIYQPGDLLLVAQPGSGLPCARVQIAANNSITAVTGGVQITPGAYTASPALSPPNGTNIFPATFGAAPQAYVFDLGQQSSNLFSVNCTSLTLFNLVNGAVPAAPCASQSNFAAGVIPVAGGIVQIQAQYGVAQANTESVSCWVSAVNAAADPACPIGVGSWATPTPANVAQIKAIRIAVVARSSDIEGQPEFLSKGPYTQPCTSSTGNVNKGPCAWPDAPGSPAPVIDLSGDPNWQRYRYKVYDTIIPIRNVLWNL